MVFDPNQQKRFGEIAQAANPQQKDPMQNKNLIGLPTMKKPPQSAIKPTTIKDPRRFSQLPTGTTWKSLANAENAATILPTHNAATPLPIQNAATSLPIQNAATPIPEESISTATGNNLTLATKELDTGVAAPEQGSINPNAPPPPTPIDSNTALAGGEGSPPSGPAGGKGGGQTATADQFASGGASGGKGGGQPPQGATMGAENQQADTSVGTYSKARAGAGDEEGDKGDGGDEEEEAVVPKEKLTTGEVGSNIVESGDIGNTGGGSAQFEDTGSYNSDVGGFDPFRPEYNQQAGTGTKVTGHTTDPSAQKRIQDFTNKQLDQWIKAGGKASDFQRFNPERESFANYSQGKERNTARKAARERFYKQQMDALLKGRKAGVQ